MLRALWHSALSARRARSRSRRAASAAPSDDGAALAAERCACQSRAALAGPSDPPRRQPLRAARWRRWLIRRTRLFTDAVAALGVALFAALALIVHAGLTAAFDLAVTQSVQAVQQPLVASLMRGVSVLGFMPLGLWIIALTGLVLWRAYGGLEAVLAVAGGAGGALAEAFKAVVLRPRPSAPDVRVTAELAGYSFPSGHTLMYVGFFGFLGYLAYARLRSGPLRTAALTACVTLIALVGVSRVYLGQHWPTDVLASYLLGFAYLILLVRVYLWRKLDARRETPAGTAARV